MTSFRRWALLSLVACVFCLGALHAFPQRLQPRIRGPIAAGDRIPFAHSRSPQARPEDDIGTVPPHTVIPGITLVFKRSPEQEADLAQLLVDQQNPASPLYHQWLQPDSFAARFGMADADLATTQTWLQSQGFHIDDVSHSRDRLTFTGTALQVQAAFGTGLHNFSSEGELHFAPASDLSLPAALASVTAAILHLSDFRPKPKFQYRISLRPDLTIASSQAHYFTPGDVATLYNLNGLYAGGFKGNGQQWAVVGQSFVDLSSNATLSYFSFPGMPFGLISSVLVPNSGVEAISPGDVAETEITLSTPPVSLQARQVS